MTKIFQIDAFTGEPFKGNPAAVVILDVEAEEGWMQSVAFEMNLSETAFVCKRESLAVVGLTFAGLLLRQRSLYAAMQHWLRRTFSGKLAYV